MEADGNFEIEIIEKNDVESKASSLNNGVEVDGNDQDLVENDKDLVENDQDLVENDQDFVDREESLNDQNVVDDKESINGQELVNDQELVKDQELSNDQESVDQEFVDNEELINETDQEKEPKGTVDELGESENTDKENQPVKDMDEKPELLDVENQPPKEENDEKQTDIDGIDGKVPKSDNIQTEEMTNRGDKDEKSSVKVDKVVEEVKEANKENVKQKERNNNTPSRSILSSIALFESPAVTQSQTPSRPTPRKEKGMFRVVQTEKCAACGKTVYAMEKLEIGGLIYHKNCFKCSVCGARLTPKTFCLNEGVLFCTHHFKQLFQRKGNYDEGFGRQQYKTKWAEEKSKDDASSKSNDSTATA